MLFAHTRAGLLPIVEYFYAGFFLPPLIARLIPGGWIVRTIFFTFGYWLILSAGTKNSIELTAIITSSVGAVLMISAILSSTDFMLWLEHPSLRLLGRISYSFYLFHFPIFYVTAVAAIWLGLPHAEIGNWLIAVASILIAMPVSAISYHFIEVRSMRIGRRLRDPAYRKLPAA
jgi:peptidoglycan/LPS O-acetylase OafA/YrhL